MKKISKIQAYQRIMKIAKAVAQVQASNSKLTPLEMAKVQKSVGIILAAADVDEQTLNKIQSADSQDKKFNVNQGIQTLLKNKAEINQIKNKPMKSNAGVKEFLKQHGIILKSPMKVGAFFKVVTELLKNFSDIADSQEELGEE